MRKPKVNFSLRWLNVDFWGDFKLTKPIEKLLKVYMFPEQRSANFVLRIDKLSQKHKKV